MKTPDHRTFRRLRLSDAQALSELCLKDTRWAPHYYQHDKWLKRALNSIGVEGRVVFGGFSNVHDRFGTSTPRLDSALFLKKSESDNSAELKNLVLREQPPSQKLTEDNHSASLHLIEKSIRFCELRGIGKLEIELPQAEHAFISIFLEKGFRILGHRERYFPGHLVYTLEKVIGDEYYRDPFDSEQLGRWLLRALLPCRVGEWQNFGDQNEVLSYLPFEIYPPHPGFNDLNPVGASRRLKGGLFILDEAECIPEYFDRLISLTLPRENHINYLMAHRLPADIRGSLEARSYVCFDRNEVKIIAGGDKSSLRIPMEEEAISGILTVLEQGLVNKYSEFGRPFIYFLLGGIGSKINVSAPEGQDDEPSLLAVHCPEWTGGLPCIVAVAEIKEKILSNVKDAWDVFPSEIPRALSKENLESYAIQAPDDNLTVLLCNPLKIFAQPLLYSDAAWQDASEMREYVVTELEHTNSVYLDERVCGILRERNLKTTDQVAMVKAASLDKENCVADIAVITIREDEQRAILSRLASHRPHLGKRGGYIVADVPSIRPGEVYRIAINRTTEQGPNEAQFSAHNAIEDLNPQWLVVVGIAGAVPDNEFTLGDVVIANRVHDFSVSAAIELSNGIHQGELANQGGPIARVIGNLISILPSILVDAPNWADASSISVPRPTVDLSETNFYGPEAWREKTRKSLSQMHRDQPIVTSKAVASSGTLVKDSEVMREFLNRSREIAHVEMEVAGVFHAANTIDRFYPVLAIRGISDVVGFQRAPEWTTYACNSAASFFLALLGALPEGMLTGRSG